MSLRNITLKIDSYVIFHGSTCFQGVFNRSPVGCGCPRSAGVPILSSEWAALFVDHATNAPLLRRRLRARPMRASPSWEPSFLSPDIRAPALPNRGQPSPGCATLGDQRHRDSSSCRCSTATSCVTRRRPRLRRRPPIPTTALRLEFTVDA